MLLSLLSLVNTQKSIKLSPRLGINHLFMFWPRILLFAFLFHLGTMTVLTGRSSNGSNSHSSEDDLEVASITDNITNTENTDSITNTKTKKRSSPSLQQSSRSKSPSTKRFSPISRRRIIVTDPLKLKFSSSPKKMPSPKPSTEDFNSSTNSTNVSNSSTPTDGNSDEDLKSLLIQLQKVLLVLAGVTFVCILIYATYYVNMIKSIYAKDRVVS